MSATKTGGFAKTWQAEWTYEDSGEADGTSLVARYEDDADGWEDRLPARGTAPPAQVGAEFRDFRLQRRTASREPGEKVKVELHYAAAWGVDEDAASEDRVKRYSMAVTLSEEPLLTHPRYAALTDEEVIALTHILGGERYKTEEGQELWEDDVTSEEGLEALGKIEDGVVAYLEPTLMWRERQRVEWDEVEEEVEIAKVGNIDAAVPGNPPIGGDRNYLYIGAQIEQDESGEFADLVNEWQLSGRSGWDEDIYSEEDD